MKNSGSLFKDLQDTEEERIQESENKSKETIQNEAEETKCRKCKTEGKRHRMEEGLLYIYLESQKRGKKT